MPVAKKKSTTVLESETLYVRARKASELLKALSHETRLVILCLLMEGEKSVSEIEDFVAIPQSTVSQQLARLRLNNLVSSRREGRMIYYRIDNEEVRAVMGALYEIYCKPAGSGRRKS